MKFDGNCVFLNTGNVLINTGDFGFLFHLPVNSRPNGTGSRHANDRMSVVHAYSTDSSPSHDLEKAS